MSQNARQLEEHVKLAKDSIAHGQSYDERDGWQWAVSEQKINHRSTGKITVICDDDHVLSELATNLRVQNYGVVEHPRIGEVAGALVITFQ